MGFKEAGKMRPDGRASKRIGRLGVGDKEELTGSE